MRLRFILLFYLILLNPFFLKAQTDDGISIDTSEVEFLLEKARQFQAVSEFDSTIFLAQRADSIAREISYQEGEFDALALLAETYNDRQELDKASEVVEDAIQKFSNFSQISRLYRIKGVILDNQGDIVGAMSALQRAEQLSTRMTEGEAKEYFLASLYHSLAMVHLSFGNQNQSFENYLKAIEFAEARSDSSFLVVLYNGIGYAYKENNELENAQYYLEKSLEIARSSNSRLDEYRALLNLANTLRDQQEFEQAISYYEQAETLWEVVRPNAPPAIIIHNKGVTYRMMNQFAQAESLLLQSLEMSESIQLPQGIYFNHLELSRLYQELGNTESALYHIQRALPLAEGSGSLSTLNVAQQQAYFVYAEANDFEKAYELLLDNKMLNDSLKTIEKEKELSRLKSTLELSRQQEVNQLLEEKQAQQEQRIRTQNILIAAAILIIILIVAMLFMARKTAREKQQLLEELRERKEELEQLNQAKDRVFSIVAHDLRSPLTSVQGVLELVKDEILKGDDLKKLVQGIDQSIKENIAVIEDLLTWAKDQLSGLELESVPVDLDPLIRDVLNSHSFVAVQKNISMESNLNGFKIEGDPNATRIVFRNLISNAIKYTEQGDEISVKAEERDDNIVVRVTDNGIGIPKEAAQKIFNSRTWSREGTKKEKGSGFGLSLSKEFTERMGGKIWFESEEGEGTTFFVQLPKL